MEALARASLPSRARSSKARGASSAHGSIKNLLAFADTRFDLKNREGQEKSF